MSLAPSRDNGGSLNLPASDSGVYRIFAQGSIGCGQLCAANLDQLVRGRPASASSKPIFRPRKDPAIIAAGTALLDRVRFPRRADFHGPPAGPSPTSHPHHRVGEQSDRDGHDAHRGGAGVRGQKVSAGQGLL